MAGKKTPAPVNLKRLYVSLLAVTLAIGIISFISLVRTRHNLNDLARTGNPRSALLDEMTLHLGEIRSSFHRSINIPEYDEETSPTPWISPAELEEAGLKLTPSFAAAYAAGLIRFEGLFQMASAAREQGKWEELQIIVRDADYLSDELLAQVQKERSRLHETLELKRQAAAATLRMTGVLLALSLALSFLIAAALYFNWRRFERNILGLE